MLIKRGTLPTRSACRPGSFICSGLSSPATFVTPGRSSGGLSAQISHLSIALHLGVTGNAAFAISYDSEVRQRLQRLARRRDSTVDFSKFLSEENDEAKRYLKSETGKGRPPPANQGGAEQKRKKFLKKGDNPNYIPQGGKGGLPSVPTGKPTWVPRNKRQKGNGKQ